MVFKNARYPSLSFANLIVVIASVSISILLFICLGRSSASSVVYVVDNEKLFDGFSMTKEIKKKGENIIKTQKIRIDSLNVEFTLAGSEQLKQQLYETIMKEKEEMQQFNEAYNSEETVKIWKRIEGYVQEYGKLKQYDLIIGSQIQGDVVYVDQKLDVTADLMNYINKKYEGFN